VRVIQIAARRSAMGAICRGAGGVGTQPRTLHLNQALMHETLRMVTSYDFEDLELGSFDNTRAQGLAHGMPTAAERIASRHFFNMRFDEQPMVLPVAMIYIPNPLARLAHRIVFSWKIRKAVERRREMDAVRQASLGRAEAAV
jgi:hypothetical protein